MARSWRANFLNLTWPDLTTQSFKLAQKISTANIKFDLIVAIARGGLTIAQLLSDQLGLPIASFTVESYKNLKQEKLPHITYGLSTNLERKKILLVDDVCDTGKTFLRGLAYLKELGAVRNNITTLSLHYKPHALYKPDYFAIKTSAWVIYPYEVRETIFQLVPIWKKSGVITSEIVSRFISWKFPEVEIRQVLKSIQVY